MLSLKTRTGTSWSKKHMFLNDVFISQYQNETSCSSVHHTFHQNTNKNNKHQKKLWLLEERSFQMRWIDINMTRQSFVQLFLTLKKCKIQEPTSNLEENLKFRMVDFLKHPLFYIWSDRSECLSQLFLPPNIMKLMFDNFIMWTSFSGKWKAKLSLSTW